ncbi:MAG TPA: SIR2 family protein [Aggregatilinea sp.]|uniref:P-loop NTPase n=1 Tax=Aggregatilinea sp. TaxID=2806333 RepID=UPI002BB917F1|nr:SIR2 family protein [Aggregatilinea sp.]HML24028.1 SIR2 family protein [Aggregatilinea sp.]
MDLPLGLRHALETDQCVLFIGAGIGAHLTNPRGESAPAGRGLSEELAARFDIVGDDVSDLARVSKIVELRKGRVELENFVRKRLSNLEPDAELRWLFSLRWRAIFTTNYDYAIQRAYDLLSDPRQKPITITSTSEIVDYDSRFEVPIYHLHGTLFGPSEPNIVITEDDYALFRERRRMLFELLKEKFATSSILYIGYSNQDPNWKMILNEMIAEYAPTTFPHSYRVAPYTDPLEQEILQDKNIETLNGTYRDFYTAAQIALSNVNLDVDRLQRERARVPQDLLATFETSPAAVLRLLTSWTYVNQEAAFHAQPNLNSFLQGDRPNWALVGSRLVFERDIEDELYESFLDYLTGNQKRPTATIVLSPAGYGTTTLLMTLAARLVEDRVGPVLMLHSGKSVLPGDIEFACTAFSRTPIFVVDNAADNADVLKTILHHLADVSKPALFIFGERLNEWRQSRSKPSASEFDLEPLSDPEISRLLDFLEEHNALGVLANLSREMQFSVVKKRHEQQLLVAMREATSGKHFDAILEGEFRGINSLLSRQLYLIVCGFYQSGAHIRTSLLADMLGISETEMYEKTSNSISGVVSYEVLDEVSGTYVARARHRTIAEIVWARCGELSERENILHKALNSLNLNYGTDKDAFDDFVRSDVLIDDIQTLDGRIRFFEQACRKDPTSPYVRQHYARMFLRAEQPELALDQVRRALDIDPSVRVLYHSQGHILSALARTTESIELARRHMVHAEGSFREGLRRNERDEYCYQGLANLYFEWAKRAVDEDETTEYLAKSEETISEGLRKVRDRESLWVLSAHIQSWLGDEPGRLQALERAVMMSPGSILARYLLGRIYRTQGNLNEALSILEPIIRNHFDEFRAFVEYAIALVYSGEPYEKAIAILQQSTHYGLRDPRYIATLGGMYFMNEDFTEASKIFAFSTKRNFPQRELHSAQFYPPDPTDFHNPLRFEGTVVAVKAGYCFIEHSYYPQFLCPASKYNGTIMKTKLKVSFDVAFTARGPIAEKPRSI